MKLRIAITGAGIGGLSAALLAHAEGHDVTLFEQFDRPGPVGSGLVIQPVGLAVLDLIGAGEEARALSCPILRMYGDTAKGDRTVLDVPYPTGAPGRAFQRAGLFDLLWRRVTAVGIPTVTSARVTAAPLDRDRRLIRLADGRAFGPFDLVVDAAGAGSHLSPIQTRPLSYGAIWGTVPWPDDAALPRDQLRQRYRRADRMVGVLPVGSLPDDPQPIATIFWSMAVDRMAGWAGSSIEDWKAEAVSIWPEISPFLRGITRNDQLITARYTHGSLSRPYSQSMVHIGDAAHRASP